jgi:hypothetical protein
MDTPFPGMDPYLERSDLWPDVHNSLITALRDDLAPRLRPRYYVSVEERTYAGGPEGLLFAGRPDIGVVGRPPVVNESQVVYAPTGAHVVRVTLPLPEQVTETFLQVRSAGTDRVITVLEVLSPSNKQPGEGRKQYEQKRLVLLGTLTHLVEIDLLRAGPPVTMWGNGHETHYRILVSRSPQRPEADLLPFSVRQPIPAFRLPLQAGDDEPLVDLNELLHALYARAGYDLRIDYRAEAEPPLEASDAAWADALLRGAGVHSTLGASMSP